MAVNFSGVKRGLETPGILLMFLLMLTTVVVYLSPKLGWRVDGLRSASMEPTLMTGDMIVTRPVVTADIRTGDVIMFQSPDNFAPAIISHRVVTTIGNPPFSFQTRGDSASTSDPFIVHASYVVGELAWRLPSLGYFIIFAKTPAGLTLLLVLPGLMLVYIILDKIRKILGQGYGRITKS